MILLQIFLGLCLISIIGFLGQWLCWEVIPTIKDKRKLKKLEKSAKKRLTK